MPNSPLIPHRVPLVRRVGGNVVHVQLGGDVCRTRCGKRWSDRAVLSHWFARVFSVAELEAIVPSDLCGNCRRAWSVDLAKAEQVTHQRTMSESSTRSPTE